MLFLKLRTSPRGFGPAPSKFFCYTGVDEFYGFLSLKSDQDNERKYIDFAV